MKHAATICLFALIAGPQAAAEDGATLWYRQPASTWEEALPVGNGRLSARIRGGVAEERIRLSEWEETLGEVRLRFADGEPAEHYRRELDLAAGLARVRYRRHGVNHRREIFASAPHRLLVVHLTAERRARVSVSIAMTGPADTASGTAGPDGVALAGPGYDVLTRAFVTGGRVRTEGNALVIHEADSVTLLAAANSAPGSALLGDRQIAEAPKVYSELRNGHLWEHARRFRKVELRLEGWAGGGDLPTDERLALFRAGRSDPGLAALRFWFGRYLRQRLSDEEAIREALNGHTGGRMTGEMLLRSRPDELHFLPELPEDWTAGHVRGLAAEDGLGVDMGWSGGRAAWATLNPAADGSYRLHPPEGQRIAFVEEGGRRIAASADAEGAVTVELRRGRRYTVRFE